MSRTNKHFDTKRNEIANKLWNIFIENGYEDTTLTLIIKNLGISKGAFYHYFSSKEECADAAIENHVSIWVNEILKENIKDLKALEGLKRIIMLGIKINITNYQNEQINSPSNKIFHQKLMVSLIKQFSPIYADIISTGIKEGIFNVKYPQETAEIMLTLINFYLDEDLFRWTSEEMTSRLTAFKEVLINILGADDRLISFLDKLFGSDIA